MNRHTSLRLVSIALFALFAFSVFRVSGADAPRATLSGTVNDDGGEVIKGARVYIYAAKPIDSPARSDTSSHPDSGKKATTDSQGKFKIEGLDPDSLFRVLVAAKGHAPKFMPDVDPTGEPIEIYLQPALGDDDPKRRVRGRIVDDSGKPVSGALVTVRGVKRGNGTRFGGNRDVDKEAVSDDDGTFEIRGENDFDAVIVAVEARALAKGVFNAAVGDKVREVKLNKGASVKGRLVKDGKPVPGVEVGISDADGNLQVSVGNFEAVTDEQGRFEFASLPAKTAYQLYGKMKSLAEQGSLAIQRVRTEKIGSTTDLGDLSLAPGYVVEGQVRLKDGGVPDPLRLSLRREEASDRQQTEMDEEGRFRFEGVPAERISISARLEGFRLSTKNASLDPGNPEHLVGRIQGHKTNLVIELEPGQPIRDQRLDGDYQSVREEPLQGAEAPAKRGEIRISGKVVDAETGQPLAAFTTTEGRGGDWPPEQINWFTMRKTEQTNGTFTVHFRKQQQRPPAILVEAEDYLPYSTGPIQALETNLTIALKKGSGIEGTVRNPRGEPVAAAKVFLTDMREGVYVQGPPFEVRDQMYRGTKSTQADEKGHFKFPASVDAYAVIVVDDAGYAEVKMEDLAETPEVRLKPYSVVKGTLMIGTKPGTNETIRLGLAHIPYADHPRHFPPLQMFLTTKTDAEGNYEFERVAPVPVQIYHEPKVKERTMGTIAVSQDTKLVLEPGRTHEVNLGGKGRPVIGKMVVKNYNGEIPWRADVHSIESIVPVAPAFDQESFFAGIRSLFQAPKTDDDRRKLEAESQKRHEEFNRKQREFYATEEGRQYHFAKKRYALNFSPDGSFRIEDVPGGKYTLRMDLREAGEERNPFAAPVIAGLQKEIEVPEEPGGKSDEPFDLGTIELEAGQRGRFPGRITVDAKAKP